MVNAQYYYLPLRKRQPFNKTKGNILSNGSYCLFTYDNFPGGGHMQNGNSGVHRD